MRLVYLIVSGVAIAIVGAVAFWKRDYIKSKFTSATPKVRGMASKAWGTVKDTTNELLHTEGSEGTVIHQDPADAAH